MHALLDQFKKFSGVVKQMGGVKELFKDEKQVKNLNPQKMGKVGNTKWNLENSKLSFNVNHSNLCTYLQVYQSMAKAMDPQMLRAIGGMQGIESMMKQMQQGGAMPGGMGMQGMEQMLKKKGKKWWRQMKQHLFQSAYLHEKW